MYISLPEAFWLSCLCGLVIKSLYFIVFYFLLWVEIKRKMLALQDEVLGGGFFQF